MEWLLVTGEVVVLENSVTAVIVGYTWKKIRTHVVMRKT